MISKRILLILMAISFMVGIIWRYHYIFVTHPINEYIYSDMQAYLDEAVNITSNDKNVILDRRDTFRPPGSAVLFGLLLGHNYRWQWEEWAQFLFSIGISILIFLIANSLYGLTVGSYAFIISSFYIPFIHYAGFLLTEIPYTFFSLLSFLFIIYSLKSVRYGKVVIWAILAGLALGLAVSMRTVVLLPAILLIIILLYLHAYHDHKNALSATLWSILGALLVIVPLISWCTGLNGGKLCVISNYGGQNVLIGHIGEVGRLNYYDKELDLHFWFANPTSLQKGYKGEINFDFAPYDQAANLSEAYRWIASHPLEAIRLSVGHVFDIFYGTLPWPISDTKFRPWIVISEYIFRIFILLPVIIFFMFKKLRQPLPGRDSIFFADLMIFVPIFGLMVLVFLTMGEPRYRVPVDPFFIILAARAYTLGVADKRGLFPENSTRDE